jgi:hypothetical protein
MNAAEIQTTYTCYPAMGAKHGATFEKKHQMSMPVVQKYANYTASSPIA